MKTSKRSDNSEIFNRIDLNGLQIHDIIDMSFRGERSEDD